MGKLNVSKKETIHAPAEKIHAVLSDVNKWRPWSPWLIAEPEAKVNITNNGKAYSWEGKRVGSGEMEITNETETAIDYNLVFLKPWKSKAKTSFYLTPKGDSTEVEWTMDSSWPFFLFFMKKQTEAFIGMDYERGLKMLKEYIEEGKVSSELEFRGIQSYEGCTYVGFTRKTNIKDVGQSMAKDFTALYNWAAENNVEMTGDPFSQYHKWDVVKKEVNYTAAIPVSNDVTRIPEGGKKGTLPALKLHTVRHLGPYDHLGNAWSTVIMQQRSKEFKTKKGIHPMEFYRNDPDETDPKDLITDVCFAVK